MYNKNNAEYVVVWHAIIVVADTPATPLRYDAIRYAADAAASVIDAASVTFDNSVATRLLRCYVDGDFRLSAAIVTATSLLFYLP